MCLPQKLRLWSFSSEPVAVFALDWNSTWRLFVEREGALSEPEQIKFGDVVSHGYDLSLVKGAGSGA